LLHAVATRTRSRLSGAVAAMIVLGGLTSLPASHSSQARIQASPVASTAWLARLNQWRISTGLTALTEDPSWSSGDYDHAVYMVKNDLVTHYETSGTPYYTTAGDTAARNSNIYVSSSTATTDAQAIDWWMQAPFHALGLMDPRLTQTGFGSYREVKPGWDMGAAVDVLRGNSFTGGRYPVFFPGNGASEPLTSYGGYESPDPLQACAGYAAPTGLPVFVQVGGNVATTVSAHSFTADGVALAHCVIDSNNSTFGSSLKSRGAAILIPRQPLRTGVQYTVSMTVNGIPYTWTFHVGSFTACTAVSLAASPLSPAAPGTTITLTANATGCPNANPLYHFSVLAPGASSWELLQDYSTNSSFTWKTTGLGPGGYRFSVWARDANSQGAFGNTTGTWDAYDNGVVFTLSTCSPPAVVATPAASIEVGETVTLTASSTGCPDPLYHFSVLAPDSTTYVLAQDYSTSPTFTWTTAGLVPGSYRFSVWARDAASTGRFGNSSGRWDTYNNDTVLSLTTCTSVAVEMSPSSPSARGTTVTVLASATGCSSPVFHFAVLAPNTTTYAEVQAYSSTASYTWNTSALSTGQYRFSVWVRDSESGGSNGNATGRWDAYDNETLYTVS
jgi:Cysteine-rich secretory protein family